MVNYCTPISRTTGRRKVTCRCKQWDDDRLEICFYWASIFMVSINKTHVMPSYRWDLLKSEKILSYFEYICLENILQSSVKYCFGHIWANHIMISNAIKFRPVGHFDIGTWTKWKKQFTALNHVLEKRAGVGVLTT